MHSAEVTLFGRSGRRQRTDRSDRCALADDQRGAVSRAERRIFRAACNGEQPRGAQHAISAKLSLCLATRHPGRTTRRPAPRSSVAAHRQWTHAQPAACLETTAPFSSSSETADRFAASMVACVRRQAPGVRRLADRSRTTEGREAPDTASSSPKSVSAVTITSPDAAACARIESSDAASMPSWATWTASCPFARGLDAILGDRSKAVPGIRRGGATRLWPNAPRSDSGDDYAAPPRVCTDPSQAGFTCALHRSLYRSSVPLSSPDVPWRVASSSSQPPHRLLPPDLA